MRSGRKGYGGARGPRAASRGAPASPPPRQFARQRRRRRHTVNRTPLQATSTDGEIVEIIGTAALNVLTNYVNKAAEVEIDFPAAPPLPTAARQPPAGDP